jgi:hypothetical protein
MLYLLLICQVFMGGERVRHRFRQPVAFVPPTAVVLDNRPVAVLTTSVTPAPVVTSSIVVATGNTSTIADGTMAPLQVLYPGQTCAGGNCGNVQYQQSPGLFQRVFRR